MYIANVRFYISIFLVDIFGSCRPIDNRLSLDSNCNEKENYFVYYGLEIKGDPVCNIIPIVESFISGETENAAKACETTKNRIAEDAKDKNVHKPEILADDYFQDEDEHELTKAEADSTLFKSENDSTVLTTELCPVPSTTTVLSWNEKQSIKAKSGDTNLTDVGKGEGRDIILNKTYPLSYSTVQILPTHGSASDSVHYELYTSTTHRAKPFPTLFHLTNKSTSVHTKLIDQLSDKLKLNITLPQFLKKATTDHTSNKFEITLGLPKSGHDDTKVNLFSKTVCYPDDHTICVPLTENKHQDMNHLEPDKSSPLTTPTSTVSFNQFAHQQEDVGSNDYTKHPANFSELLANYNKLPLCSPSTEATLITTTNPCFTEITTVSTDYVCDPNDFDDIKAILNIPSYTSLTPNLNFSSESDANVSDVEALMKLKG